jgi:hypothetical protein
MSIKAVEMTSRDLSVTEADPPLAEKIRDKIYQETKEMSQTEILAYWRKQSNRLQRKPTAKKSK